jgi:hypothetical protein
VHLLAHEIKIAVSEVEYKGITKQTAQDILPSEKLDIRKGCDFS